MGQRYLIDSNVLIDYTADRIPQKGSDFVEQIFDMEFLISVVVKIEVLGFADVPTKMKGMEEFLIQLPYCYWTMPLLCRPLH